MSGAARRGLSRALLWAAFVSILLPTPAWSQPAAGSWEFSPGISVAGGFDAGDRSAELTPNTGAPGSVTLFDSDGRVQPAAGFRARIGFYVTPAFSIEAGFRFAQAAYEVAITDDFEDADDITVEETIDQYVFDASAVWHFRGTGGRGATPFVFGGAGYVRDLHEGDALVEDGLEFHAGGGVKWWFGGAARWGFRADAGISIKDGGFNPQDKRRIVPEASGSIIWVF